ncbi:hypothetical protein Gasu2_48960 [Galdieria sulphuraria]|nr:hypothetical protein Gasu2_48960 [Galdieria sulphuraria]
MRLALLCFACLLVSTIPSSGKALEEQMTFISHNSNRGTERKSLTKDTAYKSLTAAQLNKMLSGCPSSMYLDMVSHKCVSSCPDSTYSYNNLCVETCPPQYPAIDASSRKCLATCPQDKLVYLVDNIYVCVDSCPPGYNYIHGQQCLQTCPPYTWIDTSTMTCLSGCPSHLPYRMNRVCMKECPYPLLYDGNYCRNACLPNQFQNGRNCTSQCPSDTVYNGRICQGSCHEKLTEVVGTVGGQHARICVQNCSSSKPLLFGTECVSSCPTGTVQYNGACLYGCPPIAPKHSNGHCVSQ